MADTRKRAVVKPSSRSISKAKAVASKGRGGKQVARVGHLVSKAGATKKEGMGVVKLARAVGREGPGKDKAKSGNGTSARKTIYQEGRTIRKESGRKAAMKFNKAVAGIEKRAAARKASKKPVTRKPL